MAINLYKCFDHNYMHSFFLKFVIGEDLQSILQGKDNQHHILRTEMSYYVHTHKSNKIANKDLYRLNGITYEEMLENLIILLDGEKHESTATVANLPSNEKVLQSMAINVNPALASTPVVPATPTPDDLINTMCVVVWADDDTSYTWYLGYVKGYLDGKFQVDHLARALKTSDSKWKYPSTPDIQLVQQEQIVKCGDIIGEWNMDADSRKRLYSLDNYKTISFDCKRHISEL